MPKLSDTMTEGVVAEWHKKVGDSVESGEILAEIETDKATMEFESFIDGTLLHIGIEKGGGAPVDAVLAVIGEKGEDFQALLDAEEASTHALEEEASSTPVAAVAPVSAPIPAPAPVSTPVAAPVATAPVISENGRTKSSPLARRLAEEKGINISAIAGSGEGGRVIKRDIESYVPSAGSVTAPVFQAAGVESVRDEAVSQMRKTISRRLSESKFSAPHFYLTIDIDMGRAITARKAINADGEVKISFNDLVVKAAALSLKKHPKVNAGWYGDFIRYYDHTHIGVAVAVDDGLLVPVVRFANEKSLSVINAEVKSLAEKARSKKLQPAEWEGNTFTISNLGMFGIEEFTAIINPPDACIMAVGGIREIPVVKDGAVVPGSRMKVTLSCDHRVVDGASGAAFLQTFKSFLEDPVRMLA